MQQHGQQQRYPMLSSTAAHPFADSSAVGSQSSFVPFSPSHHHQQQLLHAVAGPLNLQDHQDHHHHLHSSSSSTSGQSQEQAGEGQQIMGSAVQTNQQFQARRLFQEWTLQFGNLASHHHHRHLNHMAAFDGSSSSLVGSPGGAGNSSNNQNNNNNNTAGSDD